MKGQEKRAKAQKEHIMEKTTLKKIIKAVRDLEIKKSVNDSQFEFYSKKRKRIERKEKRMIEETNDSKEATEHYKNNKETLDFCYEFMSKVENENKIINNQIEQYLTNYIVIALVDKLNKIKTFNYKKLDKIFSQIENETDKIHKFNDGWCRLYLQDDYFNTLSVSFRGYNKTYGLMCKTKDYIENHLTKKTITKKFLIDDFSNKVNWDMKTPEEEERYNDEIESNLKNLKMKITKLINEYNHEKTKLTINQDNYPIMLVR